LITPTRRPSLEGHIGRRSNPHVPSLPHDTDSLSEL